MRRLLDDLKAQQCIDECRVVLTLNLSDEFFDPSEHQDLKLTVIRNGMPKGFGTNHNTAFEHCDSPWFVVLNPDIRLPDHLALEALIGGDSPSAALGLLAPLVLNSGGTMEDSVRTNLTPWSLLKRLRGQRKSYRPQGPACVGQPFFWLAGMFLVINAAAYRHVGGFDERFFLYCEDYDLCARLYLGGYSLALRDDVRVVHDAQRDSHRSTRHLRWHLGSLIRVWLSPNFWRITARLSRFPF